MAFYTKTEFHPDPDNPNLKRTVRGTFSTRVADALEAAGYHTVGDLFAPEVCLARTPGLGRKFEGEITDTLGEIFGVVLFG